MPQDAVQSPQLDPGFDYAKLPDGSYAKFKKGTSQAEMHSRLGAAGLIKPSKLSTATPSPYKQAAREAAAQRTQREGVAEVFPGSHQPTVNGRMPYYGMTPSNIADQVGSGVHSAFKMAKDVGKDLLSNPNWFATMPEGQRPSTMQKFVTEPAKAEVTKAKASPTKMEKVGHYMAAGLPMLGPMAAGFGEQAGHGDIGGVAGQVVGFGLGAKVVAKGSEIVVDKATGMVSADAMRRRGAELETKVIKTAEASAGGKPGLKAYRLDVASQTAKEVTIGTLKSLPDKIEAKRMAKDAQVKAIAQKLDASGVKVDVSNEVGPIVRDTLDVANQRGAITPRLQTQLKTLINRFTMKLDMQTGQMVPRNLNSLTVSEALQLQKGLDDLSEFGKQAPDAINNLARRLRGALGDKINQASPEMERLRAAESKLIVARKGARENYTKSLNDSSAKMKGIFHSGMTGLAAYGVLKMLGAGWFVAVPTIMVLQRLATSTPSRTLRAHLYTKYADLVDAALGRAASAPQGGSPGNRPVGPTNAPLVPQGPQGVAAQGVRGAPRPQGPINMGVAPASVVQPPGLPGRLGLGSGTTSEPLETRGTRLPAKASRARSGSGNYVTPERMEAAKRGFQPGNTTSPMGQAQEAIRRSVAKSNTKSATPPPVADVAGLKKAMMDRLDNLLAREPKSGAERNAIKREIDKIKRVISGEATSSETSAINKRIADRERLGEKRAASKAASPGGQTGVKVGTTAEPAAQGSSPEDRAMLKGQREKLLTIGYQKLAGYDGGSGMVKALQKQAKDLTGAGVTDYDEVTALAEALQAMKEVTGH